MVFAPDIHGMFCEVWIKCEQPEAKKKIAESRICHVPKPFYERELLKANAGHPTEEVGQLETTAVMRLVNNTSRSSYTEIWKWSKPGTFDGRLPKETEVSYLPGPKLRCRNRVLPQAVSPWFHKQQQSKPAPAFRLNYQGWRRTTTKREAFQVVLKKIGSKPKTQKKKKNRKTKTP